MCQKQYIYNFVCIYWRKLTAYAIDTKTPIYREGNRLRDVVTCLAGKWQTQI